MKRKININRPEISSQEIASRKNFDSVLKQANMGGGGGGKPFFKKPWFLSAVVAVAVAVVTTVALLNKNSGTTEPGTEQVAEDQQPASSNAELEAFYKAEEAKPCINPPIPGLNVEYTTYKINAEKGGKFNFKTGSTITFPKNAFVDADGKLLKGDVEIRYREFHDAADFFVSGIPMTYDSAGVRYQFESAGMMEMLAFQDGKPVNMAAGKTVNVELASNYSGTEYNLYKLDTNINNWSCLGKDKVSVAKKTEKPLDPKEIDPAIAAQTTPEYKAAETQKTEAAKVKDAQIAELPKPLPEPKKPQAVRKGKPTFDLEADDFPELAVYKNVLFEVGDENTTFSKSLYDITWEDISLKEGPKKGENYLITLVKGVKKYELIVYPVFEGKNLETAMKEFQDKFKKYQVTLDKRIANEKRIQEEYLAKIAKAEAEQAEIIRRMKEKQAEQFKNSTTEEKVSRMFAVSSFGVYNCDNPSAYPRGVMCTANLKAEKDRDLKCYDVFLVDKQKNALFSYARNPIVQFSFNPNSRNMIWTVENGVLYWFKPEQFNAVKGGEGMSKFEMNRVDQKFDNVEDLKLYFNL